MKRIVLICSEPITSVLLLIAAFFMVSPHPIATGEVRNMNTVDNGSISAQEKAAIQRNGNTSSIL